MNTPAGARPVDRAGLPSHPLRGQDGVEPSYRAIAAVPGDHSGALAGPERLGAATAEFLTA